LQGRAWLCKVIQLVLKVSRIQDLEYVRVADRARRSPQVHRTVPAARRRHNGHNIHAAAALKLSDKNHR